jgi:hypothetical protein
VTRIKERKNVKDKEMIKISRLNYLPLIARMFVRLIPLRSLLLGHGKARTEDDG